MKKSSNPRKIFSKRLSKVLSICGAILLGIILVIVYLPQGKLAALLPAQNPIHKTDINQPKQDKLATQLKKEKTVVKEATVVKEEVVNSAPKNDSKFSTEDVNDIAWVDEGADFRNSGRDMSNDPEYQAELKRLYSEEDLKRMDAPRQWVIMPNIIGMTEAAAVKAMHAKGLTPRVAYEDGGKKEGTVIRSETFAGQKWNTDASIFIYIQRKEKSVSATPVKKETDQTVDAAPVKPAPEKPTKPAETNKPVDSLKPEETNIPTNDSLQTEEPSDSNSNEPL